MSETWKSWKTQFKIYLRASNLESQPNQRKVALLLCHLGSEAQRVYDSFNMDIDLIDYDTLLRKFDDYFIPKTNIVFERYNFFTRKQGAEETIEDFVTALKNLSFTCEFGDIREDLVRDVFICGISPSFLNIKERLLGEANIKLDKAVELAHNIQKAKENTLIINNNNNNDSQIAIIKKYGNWHNKESNQGHKSTNKPSFSNTASHPTTSSSICSRCGQTHKFRCPALGVTCNLCKKKNHFAKYCYMKQQKINGKNVNIIQADDEDLFIGSLSIVKDNQQRSAEENNCSSRNGMSKEELAVFSRKSKRMECTSENK